MATIVTDYQLSLTESFRAFRKGGRQTPASGFERAACELLAISLSSWNSRGGHMSHCQY